MKSRFLTLIAMTIPALVVAGALYAQIAPSASPPVGIACAYNTALPTVASGNALWVQCDNHGQLLVSGGSSGGLSVVDQTAWVQGTSAFTPTGGVFNDTATLSSGQEGTWRLTTKRAGIVDVDSTGNQLHSDLIAPIADCGATPCTNKIGNVYLQSQYPAGAIPYTASATGTTAATTATLAGAANVTTYICSFSIRANATAAATGNATVTGTISGTLNFTQWTAPLASGLGVTEMIFTPCVPASAVNTSIAVVSAAPGSGGVVSVTATGYKL